MARRDKLEELGARSAPPRFLIFLVMLVAATAGLSSVAPLGTAAMLGFDVAAAAFLLSLIPLFRTHPDNADKIRERAAANDANRGVLLAVTSAVSAAILVTVGMELTGGGEANIPLVLATLTIAWLFSNMVYALHYAHLYYSKGTGGDVGGIDFPKTPEPHYWDFVYFAYTLGMTFQTSDSAITDVRMRKVVIAHSFAAFIFNLGVIAFTINVLGSAGK